MNPNPNPAETTKPLVLPGRPASFVIRFSDPAEFAQAKQFFKKFYGPAQKDDDQHCRIAMGANEEMELLLLNKGKDNYRGKLDHLHVFYEVYNDPSATEEQLKEALAKAKDKLLTSNQGLLHVVEDAQSDDDAVLAKKKPARRILVATTPKGRKHYDKDGTEFGIVGNPPFPRDGGNSVNPTQLALLTFALGVGALLLTGIQLLRRR